MKIAIITSTFPKNKDDKVPKFIETQVINLKKNYPNFEIYVLCPDNNKKLEIEANKLYTQIRFQYFFPKFFQTLTNEGIMNQLKNNILNYFLINSRDEYYTKINIASFSFLVIFWSFHPTFSIFELFEKYRF